MQVAGIITPFIMSARFLLVLLIVSPGAHLAPVTYPWQAPCVTGDYEEDNDFGPIEVPMKETVKYIVAKLKDSRSVVDNIRDYYIKHRVDTLLSDKPCDVSIDSPAVQLEGFPTVEVNLCFQMNLSSSIAKDYKSLSVMYIFNHQSMHDEDQNGVSEVSTMYKELLKPGDNKGYLIGVLCEMFNYNDGHKQPITDFASPSDMPDKYKTGSQTEKHIRDFITLNKSYILLTNLITKYELFLSKNGS